MWDKRPKAAVGCRKSWGCEPKQGRAALEHPAELSLWTRPGVQPGGSEGAEKGKGALQGEQNYSCCLWERCCRSHLGQEATVGH